MMGALQDRTAIVTGAASGIGRAIALAFAGAGANVICADVDMAGSAATCEMADAVGRMHSVRCDVSSADEARAMLDLKGAGAVGF